jgi:hypothetical protein
MAKFYRISEVSTTTSDLDGGHISLFVLSLKFYFTVKQEVKTLDDEAIRVKEQAILEIGHLFAETKQATGMFISICFEH